MVTARNKMRTATLISSPITVSGRMIETPRLRGDSETLCENEKLCRSFIQSLASDQKITRVELDKFTNSYIWKDVPKKYIIELVRKFSTHPWNLNFQPIALTEYISNDEGPLELWDVGIPQGSLENSPVPVDVVEKYLKIIPEGRELEWDGSIKNLIRVGGHHVRVGTGGCSKIGLPKETIIELREKNDKITDQTYLIKKRNPIALIHILKNTTQVSKRKIDDPDILFALGLGFPYDGKDRKANYMVNSKELLNWVDAEDLDEDEDDA